MQHDVIAAKLGVSRSNFSPPFPFALQIMAESKVKDMEMTEFGRKALFLAEHEKPRFMACREEFGCPAVQRPVRERIFARDHPS